MKFQIIQYFLFFLAIYTFVIHCLPANELTKEQKKFLQNPNNWGAQEFNKNGYGNQSNHPPQSRVPPNSQIIGNGRHHLNGYGSQNQGIPNGLQSGTRPGYGNGQKTGFGSRPINNNNRSRL